MHKAPLLGLCIGLLLTGGYHALLYCSLRGILEGGMALIADFATGIFLVALLGIVLAATIFLFLGFFRAAMGLLLGALLTIGLNVCVSWESTFDFLRLQLARSEVEALVSDARARSNISRAAPIAISWGESGFGGMDNAFYFLIHDPSGTVKRIEDLRTKLLYIDFIGSNLTYINVFGHASCKSKISRITASYLVASQHC